MVTPLKDGALESAKNFPKQQTHVDNIGLF